jgi:Flp pilus assembly CpaF family ATPase
MKTPLIYSTHPAKEAAVHKLFGPVIAEYLTNPKIQELSANYDPVTKVCRLYFDDGTWPMQPIEGTTITPEAIVTATLLLTTGAGKSLDANAAFLNCVLPCGSRYHAALPPVADGPSFSIRTHHRRAWALTDFMSPDQSNTIRTAVRDKKTIMVAGGTNTGKTSLLNAIANLIPIEERLLVIEDEPELRIRDGNVTRRRATEAADLKRQVFEALRDRPDRIIVGEVRSTEAANMLEALVTGHAGGLTTIHANGTEEAITRLMRLADCDRELVFEAIDIIVFIERTSAGKRQVKEIKKL